MKIRILLYLICLAGVVVLNCVYVDYQFMLMLLMLIIVPAFSYIMFAVSRIGMKLFVKLDRNVVSLNDKIDIKIKVVSKNPVKLAWGKLEIQVMYSNDSGVETYSAWVNAGSRQEVTVTFTPKHCGTVSVCLRKLRLRDCLKFFRAEYDYNSVRKAVVFPKRVGSGYAGRDYQNQEEDYIMSFLETDNTEVLDLRSFQEGDPMNRIHWKLSMNSEELIVKQYGEEVENRNFILVDLTKTDDGNFREVLDLIYQAAYSVGSFYVENKAAARFIVWDGQEDEVRTLDFQDEKSLENAMYELMCIKCERDSLMHLDYAGVQQSIISGQKPVLITAQEYESDIYDSVNVVKDDLEGIISALGGER